MEESDHFRSTLCVTLEVQTPGITDSLCDEMCNEMCDTKKSNDNGNASGNQGNAYRIVSNTYCTTIWYPNSKTDVIDCIVKENLNFQRKDPKNGEIYKNADGSVTVTVYHSTGKLHVQGAGSSSWTEYFDKKYHDKEEETECKRLLMSDSEETECKRLILSEPVPQMSSTPKTTKVRSGEVCDRGTEDLCELVALLLKEVETLRERLVTIEGIKGQVGEKTCREIGTQTDAMPNQTETPKSSKRKKNDNKSETPTTGKTPRTTPQSLAKKTKEKKETAKMKSTQNAEIVETSKTAENTKERESRLESSKISAAPKSTLIIGSSITQKIRIRGLKPNVRVRTMRGAEVSGIRDEIRNLNLTGLREIIIQAGGNDASSGRDIEAIENDFAEIILDVQHRSPSTSVYISEVTPRWNLDTSDVNKMIKGVCEMYNATMIRSSYAIPRLNARQFKKDGIHLTDSGTRDLLYAYEQYVAVLRNGTKSKGCAFCGENGHNFKKCHHGGKLICHACGKSGHKVKLCENCENY